MQQTSILIIGAGVSGLALGQGLFKQGIPFQIYERDSSLIARTQGYRFRITDDGIQALEKILNTEHFERLRLSCSPVASNRFTSTILDATTSELTQPAMAPSESAKFDTVSLPLCADRTVLRKILLEGIEKYVHFGKALDSFHETPEGVVVDFTDGSTAQGLALVGADGASSKVRHQLIPEYRLVDTEARIIFGKTDMTDDFLASLCPRASKDLSIIRSPGPSGLLEPMRFRKDVKDLPSDYLYWILCFSTKQLDTMKIAHPLALSTEETTALAQSSTRGWHPSLRCIYQNMNPGQNAMYRVVSARAPIAKWEASCTLVTVIGDAIHPMSPTGALGATTALQDAALLVTLLVERGLTNIPDIFRDYESSMRTYASKAIEKSAVGGRAMFGMRPFDELPEVA